MKWEFTKIPLISEVATTEDGSLVLTLVFNEGWHSTLLNANENATITCVKASTREEAITKVEALARKLGWL